MPEWRGEAPSTIGELFLVRGIVHGYKGIVVLLMRKNYFENSLIMTAKEILAELKTLGSESYKKMMRRNYGVKEPCFGVKIGDMKKIQKRIKMDYQLALDLYDTGNYDAMYLAGLIADDARMTTKDLQRWAENSEGGALAGSTVAWAAAGSPHGWDVAMKWIDSPQSHIAEAGWSTLSGLVALKEDSELDIATLKSLLERARKTIKQAPDRARYAMNGFVIATGSYVKSLTDFAVQTAEKIGPVMADLGDNQCQIPFAPDYIRKVQKARGIGKKRKTVKC
jgi:3-methyladenine DNA glycosylase AlkD